MTRVYAVINKWYALHETEVIRNKAPLLAGLVLKKQTPWPLHEHMYKMRRPGDWEHTSEPNLLNYFLSFARGDSLRYDSLRITGVDFYNSTDYVSSYQLLPISTRHEVDASKGQHAMRIIHSDPRITIDSW